MAAQLEHQFRLGRLSIQGLWFYCQVCLACFQLDVPFLVFGFLLKFSYHVTQPMMGSMQALSTVIHKASANNFTGSAVLNLLQSQVKTYGLAFTVVLQC